MIIKSLSRKSASFEDLINYFHKEHNAAAASYQWNMYGQSPTAAVAEFEENAGWLMKRKNGVVMYHEIISVPKNDKIPMRVLGAMLKDVVHQYVIRRCPNQMVYGKMHSVGHPHFHLCISSNAPGQSRRHRLAKADLARIQREVEAYTIEKYPELGTERLYDKSERNLDTEKIMQTRQERERTRRTKEPSRKETDRDTVLAVFAKAKTESELQQQLFKAGFEIYVRGRTEGIKARDGRKYRLKTLGLTSAYQTTKQRAKTYRKRVSGMTSIEIDRNIDRGRS